MSYRFAAKTVGPLAQIATGLALPASLQLTASEDHHVWALTNNALPPGQQDAWAALPITAEIPDHYVPRFDSVNDWLPGMTALFERRLDIHASASAEVSALWTSLAAPLKTAITGDIGLDLDLGIQTAAQWQATSDCWWSVTRATAAPVLRVRLGAARASARSIRVKATAAAGLDQATQHALAALAGQHRTQLLNQLRRGATNVLSRLPAPIAQIQDFLNTWLALPAAVQGEQWRNPADPLLAALKTAVDGAVSTSLAHADELTARLEFAAVRTLERRLEASLALEFDKQKTANALLDATFDFGANADLQALFTHTLTGDLTPLLAGPVPGVTLHDCTVNTTDTARHTFEWRLPFVNGRVAERARLTTAMQALDDVSGRIVRGHVKADSERHTRAAASLLSIEGAFAHHIGGDMTVHDPATLHARFEMAIATNRPTSLDPLLRLYGAPPADPRGRLCRMVITMPPASIAHWLEPQDAGDISRRMQTAWRTLLPAAVDMDGLGAEAAAPLLVWASLPVSTGARLTGKGVELNRPDSTFWDWPSPDMRQAMVWNPRTRAALEARVALTHLDADVDDLRRAVSRTVGAAVFQSLLCAEAQFIDRLTAHLARCTTKGLGPVDALRNLSYLLGGVTSAFHRKLSSVYGPESARALGPLLLTASSPASPQVEVTWTR
jgi:hypothetical protein